MTCHDPVTLSPLLGWPELEGIALGHRVLKAETEERACRSHTPRVQRLGRMYLEDKIEELLEGRVAEVMA